MKSLLVRHLVLLLLLLGGGLQHVAFAQCDVPNIPKKQFCIGQQAEIQIDDSDPDVDYHWYYESGNGLFDGQYGVDGDGRNFLSPTKILSSGTYDYYYIKEVLQNAGPTYQAPTGGGLYAPDQTEYSMTFDAQEAFSLDSVTVVVELTQPNKDYYFEFAHIFGTDTTYSTGFVGMQSDFENISGNLYKVRLPVTGIDSIPVGNGQRLELRSSKGPDGNSIAVDNFYWWDKDVYPGGDYASSTIQTENPTTKVGTDDRSPLIFDWAITTLCNLETVQVTESSDCCTPVEDDFNLTTISPVNTFKASELPVNIDAAGNDINSSMHYFWYDADGNLLSSSSGAGQSSLSATAFGNYTLRVVNDAADIDAAVCYAQKTIKIDSANLVVSVVSDACGGIVDLEAQGGIGNYTWSDKNIQGYGVMSTKTGPTTTVEFSENGTYTVEVTADVLGGEVAIDGTFDAYDKDNPRFSTTYALPTQYDWATVPSGYWVDDEVYAYSQGWCTANTDLTKRTDPITGQVSDRGNFLLFDAATGGTANSADQGRNNPIWKLVSQPVKPNTDYTFSVDVLPWPEAGSLNMMLLVGGNNDAQPEPIDLTIDGSGALTAGNKVALVSGGCNWSVVSGTWNSGTNTSVTFMVSEVGSTTSGHEGAIDNISFNTGVVKETAVVELVVNFPQTPDQIDFCTNQSNVDLEIGDGKKWKWCEDASCANEIGIEDGAPVQLPDLLKVEGESYVYLQSAETKALSPTLGPDTRTGYPDGNYQMTLEVYQTVELKSFAVTAATWVGGCGNASSKGNANFSITGPVNYSANGVSTNCGSETIIPVGWVLTPGSYTLSSNTQFQFNNGVGTVSIPGYVDVTSTGKTEFGKLTFESSSACAPVPVKLVGTNCCTQLAPTASVKTGTASICQGETLVLTATPDAATTGTITYQWYNDDGAISGATFQDYTVPTTSAAAAKDYWVTVTSSGSCTGESPESNKVSVTVNATPSAPTVTSPVEYCEGETASTLSATGTGLTWYTTSTGGTGSSSAPTPTTTSVGTTSYYVSQTVTGCEGPRAQLDVTIKALPSAPTVTSPVEYCEGETASALSATGTGTLTWYTSATGGSGSTSAPTPSTATAGTTSYYVSQVENGCEGPRAQLDVEVNAIPSTPTVTSPVEYCEGATASVLSATGTGTLNWYTSATGGTGSTTAPTPSTATAGTTSYYVSQEENNCESSRAQLDVVVNAVVSGTPVISGDLTVCESTTNETYTVTGVSNADDYTWTVGGTALGTTTSASVTVPSFAGQAGNSLVVEVEPSNAKCGAGTKGSATVVVDAEPSAPALSSTSFDICPNDPVIKMPGTNATSGTGKWENVSVAGRVVDVNAYDSDISGLTGGSSFTADWVVRSANDACPADVQSVTINGTSIVTPSVSINEDAGQTDICVGTGLNFTAAPVNGGGTPTYEFFVDAGSGYVSQGTASGTATFSVTPSAAGTYKYKVAMVSSSNCVTAPNAESPEWEVKVDAEPSAAVIQSPTGGTNICTTGLTLTADAITVGTGAWSVDDATKGSISSAGALTINNEGESVTVTYIVTSPNGVCTAKTDDITITRVGSITAPDAGSATTICEGTSHQLGANASLKATETGTWSFVSNSNGDAGTSVSFSDLNAHDATVSNLPFGDNVLQWEVADASSPCAAQTATVTISVDEAPETAALADPTMTTVPTCANPTNLDAEAASLASGGTTATGAWTLISGPGNIVSGQENNPAAQVENLVNGSQSVFRWTVSNGTCVDHSSVDVTLDKLSDITVAEITYGTATLAQDEEVDVCLDDGTINFNGSSAASGEQGTWTVVSGTSVALVNGSNTASQSGVTLTGMGKTEVTWSIAKTTASGCPASERTVVFNVTDVPEDPTAIIAAGGVTDVCAGETVNLSVATPFPARVVDYVWSSGIAGNSDSESHTFTSDPTETITVHARNACGQSANPASYTMNVVPAPSVDFSLPAGCKDEEVTFTANANASVSKLEWFVDGLSESTSNPFLYTFMDGALHKVKVVGELASNVQCTAGMTDEFELDFTALAPTIALISSNEDNKEELSSSPLVYVQHLCGAESVNFTETGAESGTYTWTWMPSNTPASQTVSGTDPMLTSDILQVTKEAGCNAPLVARVSFDVIALPNTEIIPDGDSTLCKNDDQTVFLLSGESDPSYAYQWYYRPVGGIWSAYSNDIERTTVAQPGDYKVYIEKDWSCGQEGPAYSVGELDVNVVLPGIIELDRTDDEDATVEVAAEEIGASKNYTYTWSSTSNNVGFSPDNAQVTMVDASELSQINVTAELGRCRDTASAILYVYKPVQIPAAFTPNGDGYNDNWIVGGLESYPAASVKIYNRWGNEVYRKFEGYNGDWYGTRDGKELPDGVYFYVIELGTGDKSYRGSVTIAR